MSADLNQCNFVGRLGKDPETRFTQAGKQVTSFSIAVSYGKGDAEKTEWVNVTAWDKLAEICDKYLKKGAQVFISGRMQTDSVEKDGSTRYYTKIVAERMQMLGGKQQDDSGSQERARARPPATSHPAPFEDAEVPF